MEHTRPPVGERGNSTTRLRRRKSAGCASDSQNYPLPHTEAHCHEKSSGACRGVTPEFFGHCVASTASGVGCRWSHSSPVRLPSSEWSSLGLVPRVPDDGHFDGGGTEGIAVVRLTHAPDCYPRKSPSKPHRSTRPRTIALPAPPAVVGADSAGLAAVEKGVVDTGFGPG